MKKTMCFAAVALMALAAGFTSCTEKEVVATDIKTDPTTVVMYVDSTVQLTAAVEPTGAKVTWESEDMNTASVDDNGLVTAKVAGEVKVYAVSGTMRAATKISIYDNPVTCQLEMLDVVQKKCTVHITPSNEEGYYYCGYIDKANLGDATDEEIKESIIATLQYYVEQYQAAGYDYTMADFLKQGEKNLIASGMTANTEYVMFAFGIDVINEKAVAAVTRLPFTTTAVVPSNLTFNIKCDSVTSTTSTKGVTTNKAWFTVNPSNEEEAYLLIGASKAAVEEQGSIEAYATYMEQYYDKKYSSYGGVDYALRTGNKAVYMTVNDSTEYVIAAVGYNGGFTTKVFSLNYKYEAPQSKRALITFKTPDVSEAINAPLDESVIIIPGMCHE